jgi:ABC-2 type transport system permease protein
MSEFIIALGLLLTMIIGAISFSGERENGTLESLLITPVKRIEFTLGKLLGIMGMWFLILIVSVPYVYVMGYGTNDILPMIAFLLIPGTILIFSFACLSMAFSTFFHSSKNALLSSLVIFIFTGITVFLPSSATTTVFAKFLSNNGPVTNIFHFMDEIFTARIGLTNLTAHAVPLIIWTLFTYLFLFFETNKLTFEGGE